MAHPRRAAWMRRRRLLLVAVGVVAAVVVGLAVAGDRVLVPSATAGSADGAALAAPTSRTPVVTIGDSIMAGHGLPAGTAWPDLLSASGHRSVTNLGCSGAGFIAVGDCGSSFDGLIDQAVAAHPGVVVIESSDNDLDADAPSLTAATASTIAHLRAALPHARIVGLSTLWDQPGETPAEVAASAADLRAAVTGAGGTFLDVGQPLAGHSDLLQSDSEHPTEAGQKVLADVIRARLASVGVVL